MKTLDQDHILEQIKSMSELELSELIDGIKDHCYKNKMSHLFDDCDYESEMESLQDEIEDMTKENEDLRGKLERSKIDLRQRIVDLIENMDL